MSISKERFDNPLLVARKRLSWVQIEELHKKGRLLFDKSRDARLNYDMIKVRMDEARKELAKAELEDVDNKWAQEIELADFALDILKRDFEEGVREAVCELISLSSVSNYDLRRCFYDIDMSDALREGVYRSVVHYAAVLLEEKGFIKSGSE